MTAITSDSGAAGAVDGPKVVGKITGALIPFLGILYLIAYIDRQNVGYAKLDMVADLGISEGAYGLGAGLFFIGYFLFEVPSNLILDRVGARLWFARIMVSWGLVTVGLGFTQNVTMFYVLRFLLGACEAGFFPGVLYLLTVWFPQDYRARMTGLFMLFSALANAIGAPIGGLLLELHGVAGLKGWQWVFLCTGVPAVLAGIVTLFYLPDSPRRATFLAPGEAQWLERTIASESGTKTRHGNPYATLLDMRVVVLSFFYVLFPLAAYGLSYWLPTIVKSFGATSVQNGFINVIPWVLVAAALWWWPRHADRTGERTFHVAIPAGVAAIGLVASVFLPGDVPKFAALCVAAVGIFAGQPVFWSIPSRFLTGASAAAGLAMINSIGNLGGFVAQYAVPAIRDATGSTLTPMLFLAACMALACVLTFVVQGMLSARSASVPSPGAAR